MQETNSSGNVSFVNSGLGLSSKTNSNGSIYYTRCSCGELIGDREPGGSKYYYLLDAQGSVVATTDSSGTLVDGYVYKPFGTLSEYQEPHPNPWQFQSGFNDPSTGLYKFGERYYDPTVGRWTQQDPVAGSLADVQGLNRYVFAGDDPINAVDPSGRQLTYHTLYCAIGLIGASANALLDFFSAVGLGYLIGAAELGAFLTPFLTYAVAIIAGIAIVAGFILALGYCSGTL